MYSVVGLLETPISSLGLLPCFLRAPRVRRYHRFLLFRADDGLTSGYFLVSPALAFTSAALAWRNAHLLLAALIVTAPTFVGLLFVIVFTISVALYGF